MVFNLQVSWREPSQRVKPIRILLKHITKIYPGGIVANKDISLEIKSGEVLALLGENGAGKTTLVSIVAGHIRPTRGEIFVDGVKASFRNPRDALRQGIVMVPQHPRLIDSYTVAENIGVFMRSAGLRAPSRRRLEELVRRLSTEYGLEVDPRERVWSLSFGEKQRVELLRALAVNARLLILDEPTTHMTPIEARRLIGLMRRLVGEGRAVVFITHKLREAMEAADRIAVLRSGRLVGIVDSSKADERLLLEMMFGRVEDHQPLVDTSPRPAGGSRVVLEVKGLWVKGDHGEDAVRNATLRVHRGEILGVAGIAGNGQREFFEALVGLRKPHRGRILVEGRDVTRAGPRARLESGIAIIPEERLGWALVPGKSIVFNIVFALLYAQEAKDGMGMVVDWDKARGLASMVVKEMSIKAPSLEALVDELSGGNMQKLIVGRETMLRKPRLIVAMNPTSGLDYETTLFVRRALYKLTVEKGTAIVWFSEDLDELLEVSMRIAVLSRGEVVGVFEKPFNVEAIARAMTV
ncbi:MAG: ABC transporter ATP-binding protein [Pyrodictiaceae archaeon]